MKPMRSIFFAMAVCSFFPVLAVIAAERTWTSSDGRTLKAEYISSRDGSVTLRRASDRREFTVPLDTLSEDDRKWVSEREAMLAAEASKIKGPYADLITGDWALSEHGDLPFAIYGGKDLDARETYPLVLSLHGKSDNNENGKQIGFARSFTRDDRYEQNPCIVVAPLCYQPYGGTGGGWSDKPGDETIDLVKDLIKNLPVDENRVYVVGYSMGGYGTVHLMSRENRLFTAGVPVAGAGGAGAAGELKRTPLWLWHAADDNVVSVDGSRQFADAFGKSSKTFKYTELPTGGHGIVGQVFDNEEVHEWLFKQGVEEAEDDAL